MKKKRKKNTLIATRDLVEEIIRGWRKSCAENPDLTFNENDLPQVIAFIITGHASSTIEGYESVKALKEKGLL